MTSGLEMTSRTLTSCQTHTVHCFTWNGGGGGCPPKARHKDGRSQILDAPASAIPANVLRIQNMTSNTLHFSCTPPSP